MTDNEKKPGDMQRVDANKYFQLIAQYFKRISDLWEGPDGSATDGTHLCDELSFKLMKLGSEPMELGNTEVPTLRFFFDLREQKDPRYALTESLDAPKDKKTKWDHIDEWLDSAVYDVCSSVEMAYVHFMFTHFRKPAWEKNAHSPFMSKYRLYVDYEGRTWRVTGASSMGDIWLSSNLTAATPQPFYDRRVGFDLSKLTHWHDGSTGITVPEEEPTVLHVQPRRHGKNAKAKATGARPSGQHFKEAGEIKEVTVPMGDTTVTTISGNLWADIQIEYPEGTKLYVRTK